MIIATALIISVSACKSNVPADGAESALVPGLSLNNNLQAVPSQSEE